MIMPNKWLIRKKIYYASLVFTNVKKYYYIRSCSISCGNNNNNYFVNNKNTNNNNNKVTNDQLSSKSLTIATDDSIQSNKSHDPSTERKMTTLELQHLVRKGKKIAMITAYDYPTVSYIIILE
jgi:hypothetical protein